MSARRTPEYEEELGCPKEENEPDRQLLDAAFNLQHRTVLRGADITEDLRTEWQEPKPPHIKEEEEPILIKKEEEEEDITKFPQTGVPLKGEDEGQSEESRGAEPPSSSSTHHMRTEAERDHCGGSQADGLLAPLSDSDDMSHPPHTDENHHDKQSESAIICHTDNKRWKCSQCGKTFAYISSLKQHVRIHTGEKPFACSVCSKRFTQKGYLKKHTKSHIGEKPFSCTVCGQRFSVNESLKLHTRTHTGERPFSCSVCGQRFTQKGVLNRHTRTHTGEKPFSCSVCGQRFSVKDSLKLHTRTHTGEKPFPCSVCGQRFTQKGHLKIHAIIHTGEKPFCCSVCGQRFTQKGELKRHTRTHTGEKPFSCSVCGQRFSVKDSLKLHTRTHTGEKPFSCSVCGQRFTQKGHLKMHTRTHSATHLPPINPHHHLHLSLLVPGNPRQSIAAYPSGTTAHQTHVSYPIPCSLVNSCLLVPSVPDSRHSCQPPVLSTACHLFIILHQSPPALGFSYFPHLTHMMLF
ncbi:zinc finger protein 260-like isoform X2 [Phycodurus eques]|uniref:zinc finger protein 260-like isoform X2 n=1 Tax=Phycodurus eques TaxID=693459 RepID=UPI002ACDCEA3|nr:zinc finger protein 260-like isoform X2 [Phycodurus eques]XP_061536249.1 zinc finger protein 260-like isoform X2 [Phycodurus eques]XP_061536250.1 zinc finger protein 260-like isoform X2 [Phycodurus eques]XP_061536251.1 zinc finger protein 260-like isoform X2 [Phycodurus eques]